MRKIIQISTVPSSSLSGGYGGFSNDETLYALCDDGSVFWICMSGEHEWTVMPPVPRDDSEDAVFLAKEAEAVYDEAAIDQSRAGWETVKETIHHALYKAYVRGRQSRQRAPASGIETWERR